MARRPSRRSSRRPIPRKQAAAKPAKPKAAEPAPAPPVAKTPQPASKPKPSVPAVAAPRAKPAKPAVTKPAPVAAAGGSDSTTAVASPPTTTVVGDPYIGLTVGRCLIEERIGLGKTAAVYRAHYEALDEKVAVKVLTPQARKMPELVERFHSEAKVIARLDNQNVVKVYDVGREGELHFMVMELLDGFSVLDLIQREEQVDHMDALRIVRQAAEGLGAAHAKGIIHRDVKPQNMLLLEDGTVKVLDFGLAAGFDDKSERVGTPHYMAPEICRDGNADLGSDIYALGIVLWHLLKGQPPYAGLEIKAMLRKHIEGVPLRIEQARRDVPKDVAELIRSLTRSDPLLRPTAPEVVELIDRIGGEEVKERSGLRRSRSGRRARAAARKKSALGPALAGLVAVVGIVVAVAMSAGSDPKEEATETAGSAGTGSQPIVVPENPTPTDTETMEEREARLRVEREAAEEKADYEKAQAAKTAGAKSLAQAITWARENWHGPTDTTAVINKYQRVYTKFRKTEAGKKARELLVGIKKGKIHPHPDRSWSDADSIAAAREAWRASRPVIEAKIKAYDYPAAFAKLPDRVNASDGTLTAELRFWERILTDIKRFKSSLATHGKDIPKDERTIKTPEGEGEVRVVRITEIEVEIKGTRRKFKWTDFPPEDIFALARSAFYEKGYRLLLQTLAFAYAHKLDEAFWDVQLDVTSAKEVADHKEWVAEVERRFNERVK